MLDFREGIRRMIHVNVVHVTRTDWGWIAPDYSTTTALRKVPPDDNVLFEQLVREGCSFAYVSLLQTCARRGFDFIYFDPKGPIISGLETFDSDWDLQRSEDLTPAAASDGRSGLLEAWRGDHTSSIRIVGVHGG